jgi:hypothetical protein
VFRHGAEILSVVAHLVDSYGRADAFRANPRGQGAVDHEMQRNFAIVTPKAANALKPLVFLDSTARCDERIVDEVHTGPLIQLSLYVNARFPLRCEMVTEPDM